MNIQYKYRSIHWPICIFTICYLVRSCYAWQRDTCDLGWRRRRHKAASSALLFSSSTKAVVLSLAPQTPFPPHSAQGQGRINMQLWWFIPSTVHFNARPLQYGTKHHVPPHQCITNVFIFTTLSVDLQHFCLEMLWCEQYSYRGRMCARKKNLMCCDK